MRQLLYQELLASILIFSTPSSALPAIAITNSPVVLCYALLCYALQISNLNTKIPPSSRSLTDSVRYTRIGAKVVQFHPPVEAVKPWGIGRLMQAIVRPSPWPLNAKINLVTTTTLSQCQDQTERKIVTLQSRV